MTKEIIYIMARSGKKEDVYDAVFSWISGFDSMEEAKKYGLNSHNKAIIEKVSSFFEAHFTERRCKHGINRTEKRKYVQIRKRKVKTHPSGRPERKI